LKIYIIFLSEQSYLMIFRLAADLPLNNRTCQWGIGKRGWGRMVSFASSLTREFEPQHVLINIAVRIVLDTFDNYQRT